MENNNQPDDFLIKIKKDFDKQFGFEDSEEVVEKTPEEETLIKIKSVLFCNNDSQAIRLLEQYADFKIEQSKNK